MFFTQDNDTEDDLIQHFTLDDIPPVGNLTHIPAVLKYVSENKFYSFSYDILINFFENFIKFKFISETIGVTLAAQIMLLPIMAYYFNTISIISLITNFLVITSISLSP